VDRGCVAEHCIPTIRLPQHQGRIPQIPIQHLVMLVTCVIQLRKASSGVWEGLGGRSRYRCQGVEFSKGREIDHDRQGRAAWSIWGMEWARGGGEGEGVGVVRDCESKICHHSMTNTQ
jgi:hypothetical protein